MYKLKRKYFLVIACFMLIMTLTACGNADFVGNSYKVGNNITIEFQILNMTETQEIDLKSGDTVQFDVTRESGQIDIAFGLKNALPDYEGKSVESNSFTVTVHEDGRYVLNVTGSEAKGSVKLTKLEQK
ncbi:MAG: hypothetical protein Q3995_06815 [Eubacteriales bacterium]|nr:hypothetical protein [Eubacteriales bacterium]